MSPPEVWGPAIWTLFHCLAEKIQPDAYPQLGKSMFGMIVKICRYLPCPECSNDASNYLAKVRFEQHCKTREEFQGMLFRFHNFVNAKKRKRIFPYIGLKKYEKMSMAFVANQFVSNYNTKGNMKLLTESFHRQFVIREFIAWFSRYARAFTYIQPAIITSQVPDIIEDTGGIIEDTGGVIDDTGGVIPAPNEEQYDKSMKTTCDAETQTDSPIC